MIEEKFCKDCKWGVPDKGCGPMYWVDGYCTAPQAYGARDIVTKTPCLKYASAREARGSSHGCGYAAKWFQPKGFLSWLL